MAYNFEEQIKNDYDILIFDGKKLIHIASAGGILPAKLSESEINFRLQMREVYKYRRVFETELNSDITRNNLTNEKEYLNFFLFMSKRGFYSYDRVNIDNIEDQQYQLISKPKYNRVLSLSSINKEINPVSDLKYPLDSTISFIESNQEFPENFTTFDLRDFI